MTKNLSVLLFIPILFSWSCGQLTKEKKITWNELTAFKIYDYKTFPEDKTITTFTESEIEKMNFIETDLNEAKAVLEKSIPVGNKVFLWKGDDFATATFSNGETRRIKVSVYGGFFLDLTGQQYYEFKGKGREEWDTFWNKFYYQELHKIDEK